MTIEGVGAFIRLRTSPTPEDQHRAATEDASFEVWRELVRDHPDMRFWVAQNKTVPLEILQLLARDEDTSVRSMVERKRAVDPPTLDLLAGDADDGVRLAVARNPATSEATLRRLVDDPYEEVRAHVRRRLDVSPSQGGK